MSFASEFASTRSSWAAHALETSLIEELT